MKHQNRNDFSCKERCYNYRYCLESSRNLSCRDFKDKKSKRQCPEEESQASREYPSSAKHIQTLFIS